MPMEWCCRTDISFSFFILFFFFFCFVPPSPWPLSHTCACMHADSPVPGLEADQTQLLLDTGASHSSGSRLCSCQEFLGADRKRCWPKWHVKPSNVWEHINLLPGGKRRPRQVPIILQACASTVAVEQARQSQIQRGSCCGVGLRMLWQRCSMTDGKVEACFPDRLQTSAIFDFSISEHYPFIFQLESAQN